MIRHRLFHAPMIVVVALAALFARVDAQCVPPSPGAQPVGCACDPPAGLTSWWPGQSILSDIWNGYDAAFEGDATYGPGRLAAGGDVGFDLDGNFDYLTVPQNPALDLGKDDFTISLWVNFDSTSFEQVLIEQWIQNPGGSSAPVGWTFTKRGSNALQFAMTGNASVNTNSLSINAGTWNHFAVRRAGNSFTIFANGTQVGSGTSTRDLTAPTSLKFGSREGTAFFLNGFVDEVQMFVGRALTNSEIQNVLANGSVYQCAYDPVCGTGRRELGELCDDGNAIANDGCESDCTLSCGNGVATGEEECDDGNLVNGDGCDETCTVTGCGNGIATAGEECDDGNLDETDDCLSTCFAASCGDGYVYEFFEPCDDGNLDQTDDCTNSCELPACGDGFVHAGVEACDDGNPVSGDGCDSNCTVTACGNGVRTAGELCDDGNLVNGDGCEDTCVDSPGRLDPSFSGDGIATVPLDLDTDPKTMDMAIQDDDKILVLGTTGSGYSLVRFEADGTADAGFGTGGVLAAATGSGTAGRGLALQPDGKIVVTGQAGSPSNDATVWRFNADGSPDTTFDGDGVATISIDPGDGVGYDVAIQADGKIVVVGKDGPWMILARLHADGSLDTTFDGDGVVTAFNLVGYSLAVQTDGKIVIAGIVEGNQLWLVRYTSTGANDTRFSSNGIVETGREATHDLPPIVAVQADGGVVVGTYIENEGQTSVDFAVLRFDDDGEIDEDFGADGETSTHIGTDDDYPLAMALDGASRAVLAGLVFNDAFTEIGVVRYDSDGAPDTGFDFDGKLTTGIGIEAAAGAVAVQPNGRVVVAGHSLNGPVVELTVVRYLAGGCGDLVLQTSQGESCDDGNETNGDGCEANCKITPVNVVAAAGETVTTDPLGNGATRAIPLQTAIKTKNAGTVQIAPSSTSSNPKSLNILGLELQIEAPPASVEDPLEIYLTIDGSLIPEGVDPLLLAAIVDGDFVPDCEGALGTADPDPCVDDRTQDGDDVTIKVLTSHASQWGVVVRGLDRSEQKCVNAMNGAGVKVAKAQAKAVAKCLKNAAKGTELDAQGCLTADVGGKVAKVLARTSTTEAKKCEAPVPFALTDAATINDAGVAAEVDLAAEVFGADLTSAVLPKSDRDGSKCQAAVLKATQKLFETKAREFLKCKKDALKGKKVALAISASTLSNCLALVDADVKGKIAKSAAKITKALDKRCEGVDIPSAFPASCFSGDTPVSCLDDRTDCLYCTMFDAMDDLGADCDALDDGEANGSCAN